MQPLGKHDTSRVGGGCAAPLNLGDASWGIACRGGVPYRDSPFVPPYCVFCPPGLVSVRNSSTCAACAAGTFVSGVACVPKAVVNCGTFSALVDMGPTQVSNSFSKSYITRHA